MKRANSWTDEEIAFLRTNYGTLSFAEIGEVIGKSAGTVKSAAGRYGVSRSKRWTEEERQTLIAMYPDHTARTIADKLGRGLSQIYGMAEKLGLKKSEAFLTSEASGRLNKSNAETRGGKSRFQKGQVSWNKGTKGISGQHPNCRRTQFKKGQLPHNAAPVGSEAITTDGYRKIKLAEPDVWEFVHRRTWEAAHGPIRDGMMIRFKDGNQLNCDLDNLMLVTRGEHALYNSPWKIPAEIVPAMAALAALKKELNNYAQEQAN